MACKPASPMYGMDWGFKDIRVPSIDIIPSNISIEKIRQELDELINNQNMNALESQYRSLVREILNAGELRETRTGQTRAVFNKSISVDLPYYFPMITGRAISWRTVYTEFKWMYLGHTNIKFLNEHGVHIWDQWASKNGDLGKTYGYYLKKVWQSTVSTLKNNPMSRRVLIDLWDDSSVLPCCYHSLNFYQSKGYLNMTVSFRSSDVAIGLPHDIPVLALILHQMAAETGHVAGTLTCNLTDAHINEENTGAMYLYLDRSCNPLPTLFRLNEKAEYPNNYSIKDYAPNNKSFPKMIVKP